MGSNLTTRRGQDTEKKGGSWLEERENESTLTTQQLRGHNLQLGLLIKLKIISSCRSRHELHFKTKHR